MAEQERKAAEQKGPRITSERFTIKQGERVRLRVMNHDDGILIRLNDMEEYPGLFYVDRPGSDDYDEDLTGYLKNGRNYLSISIWNHEKTARSNFELLVGAERDTDNRAENWGVGHLYFSGVYIIQVE